VSCMFKLVSFVKTLFFYSSINLKGDYVSNYVVPLLWFIIIIMFITFNTFIEKIIQHDLVYIFARMFYEMEKAYLFFELFLVWKCIKIDKQETGSECRITLLQKYHLITSSKRCLKNWFKNWPYFSFQSLSSFSEKFHLFFQCSVLDRKHFQLVLNTWWITIKN
jgi:hypothetical protein